MKVLVIGSGGREHAIVWKLTQSDKISKIYCAPGNGGISRLVECVDIAATDSERILQFALQNKIDLTLVIPDNPLALGLVDLLNANGLAAFGPTKAAAQLEWSKVYAKQFMQKYNIPTGEYQCFTDYEQARQFAETCRIPMVIKADGLAFGKGVIVALDRKQLLDGLDTIMLDKAFGQSGDRVIFEEYLVGPEVSVLTFTDGKTVYQMPSSQDHKRAFDGDKGLNTGGMGAFSPSRIYTEDISKTVMNTIILPTIKGMQQEGTPFKGVLYFGLMITENGPKVIEYNARFGDPETQAVLPLLRTDLFDIITAIVNESLDSIQIKWHNASSVCIVLASGGYPGSYAKGYEIKGLSDAENMDNIHIFHAGTTLSDNVFKTSGGRVLGVTAIGDEMEQAVQLAYKAVDKIDFKDKHFRTDIGKK